MDKPDYRDLFIPADILVPAGEELTKWSVVACDQHTSEPEYWDKVAGFVGGAPSTLRMMLPEHTYNSPELNSLVASTKLSMSKYLTSSVFREVKDSFIYVERTLYNGQTRCGIVGALDLEQYDYLRGSSSAVRATEGTVVEKLPVRIRLRENAPVELTHVLVLADDPDDTLISPLSAAKGSLEKLYDFELMEKGGHIRGWRVGGGLAENVRFAVSALGDREAFNRRYGLEGAAPMVFATGDGNHSLATAKACWENLKRSLPADQLKTHPARYALVEIVNIHEKSLEFLPINRVAFDVDPALMLDELLDFFPGSSVGHGGGHEIGFVHGSTAGVVSIPKSAGALAVGVLSRFLEDYISRRGGHLDFVHGDDVVIKLAQRPGCLGFVLPVIDKSSLFLSVIQDGALPRKTFSMGSSNDKRYYLECRRIK